MLKIRSTSATFLSLRNLEAAPEEALHQELKWKLGTLSVWEIWILEFLGPQNWDTKGGGIYNTSKTPGLIGLGIN